MTEINRQISEQDLNAILGNRVPDIASRDMAGSVLTTIDAQLNILVGLLGAKAALGPIIIIELQQKLPVI